MNPLSYDSLFIAHGVVAIFVIRAYNHDWFLIFTTFWQAIIVIKWRQVYSYSLSRKLSIWLRFVGFIGKRNSRDPRFLNAIYNLCFLKLKELKDIFLRSPSRSTEDLSGNSYLCGLQFAYKHYIIIPLPLTSDAALHVSCFLIRDFWLSVVQSGVQL